MLNPLLAPAPDHSGRAWRHYDAVHI